jgi:hypothetical protein
MYPGRRRRNERCDAVGGGVLESNCERIAGPLEVKETRSTPQVLGEGITIKFL